MVDSKTIGVAVGVVAGVAVLAVRILHLQIQL